ncbi:hypothetical protein CI102_14136 [Trichoderma harzianum]|nr:hypothetical protein CI102_14136 [Trichoderma harzianum]
MSLLIFSSRGSLRGRSSTARLRRVQKNCAVIERERSTICPKDNPKRVVLPIVLPLLKERRRIRARKYILEVQCGRIVRCALEYSIKNLRVLSLGYCSLTAYLAAALLAAFLAASAAAAAESVAANRLFTYYKRYFTKAVSLAEYRLYSDGLGFLYYLWNSLSQFKGCRCTSDLSLIGLSA